MSFGPFIRARYASGTGASIHDCRIQPETLSLDIGGNPNAQPAGAVNNARGVRMSGGSSPLTIGARAVGVRVTGGGGPYAVGTVHYVPWLDPSTFFDVLIPSGQTGDYNGSPVVVIGSRPERL